MILDIHVVINWQLSKKGIEGSGIQLMEVMFFIKVTCWPVTGSGQLFKWYNSVCSGHGVGIWHFSKICLSNSRLPTGKSFQSNATKFPHPAFWAAHCYQISQGTMKISPSKILRSLFINVAESPNIHVPVTAAILRFNHNPTASCCLHY